MNLFNRKATASKSMAVKVDRHLLIADYHLQRSVAAFKIAANHGNQTAENILHMFCMAGLPVQNKAI